MIQIKRADTNIQEVQFLMEKRLDHDLVKIFVGELAGSVEERRLIASLIKKLKNDFFVEVIYILSHLIIKDARKAKQVFFKVIKHRDHLNTILKRKVGIEVAALDYLKNIYPLLEAPQVIEKMKLLYFARKAITDATTGTLDKVSFWDNLQREIERSKRYKKSLAMLFCDIDGFKSINDLYGHIIGDRILVKVSKIINNSIRKADRAYRFGGEEFICLLVETNITRASVVARRIKKNINDLKIMGPHNKKVIVTLSIGICQYGTGEIKDAKSFVRLADQMMYNAKQDGKNCVRVYKPRAKDEIN